MKDKNKIRFEFPLCNQCAVKRRMKLEIFQLKRGRNKELQACFLCQQQTNLKVIGFADSDKEIELIKRKLR